MISIGPSSARTCRHARRRPRARSVTSTAMPSAGRAAAAQLVGGARGGVAVEVEQRDPVPARREALADGEPHARCGAGDHRDPAHRAPPGRCVDREYGPTPNGAASWLSQNENAIATRRRSVRVAATPSGGGSGADRPDDRPRAGPLPREGRAARRRRRGRRAAGFTSIWVPQIPNDFDALTAIALMGAGHVADRARHRGDADPDPPPGRDGAAGARRPRRCARAASRSASGRRTTGSSRTCSACRTTSRRGWCATTSRC